MLCCKVFWLLHWPLKKDENPRLWMEKTFEIPPMEVEGEDSLKNTYHIVHGVEISATEVCI